MYAAIVHEAFNDFVPKQSKDTSADKERSGVAIPINAGGATRIIYCAFRSRAEFAHFLKLQIVVAQKQYGR